MFPTEFDHRTLGTLPFPSENRTRWMIELLRRLTARRTIPHFKNRRGTDPILLARSQERLSIRQLEDEANRNCLNR